MLINVQLIADNRYIHIHEIDICNTIYILTYANSEVTTQPKYARNSHLAQPPPLKAGSPLIWLHRKSHTINDVFTVGKQFQSVFSSEGFLYLSKNQD